MHAGWGIESLVFLMVGTNLGDPGKIQELLEADPAKTRKMPEALSSDAGCTCRATRWPPHVVERLLPETAGGRPGLLIALAVLQGARCL